MKHLLIAVFALTTLFGYSQDIPKFELTKDGVSPIIVNIDSMSAEAIYKKTLNWVQESYKTPKEVLKTNIENEKIRVDGFKKNAWFYKSLGVTNSYDIEYSFEVEFKENKIRLTFTPGQFWADNQKVLYDYKTFFKSSGEVKGAYKDAKPSLEQSMNDLTASLYNYIKGKKSDW